MGVNIMCLDLAVKHSKPNVYKKIDESMYWVISCSWALYLFPHCELNALLDRDMTVTWPLIFTCFLAINKSWADYCSKTPKLYEGRMISMSKMAATIFSLGFIDYVAVDRSNKIRRVKPPITSQSIPTLFSSATVHRWRANILFAVWDCVYELHTKPGCLVNFTLQRGGWKEAPIKTNNNSKWLRWKITK